MEVYEMAYVPIVAIFLASACAMRGSAPRQVDGVAISLTREVSDRRPMLVATITNRSGDAICIRTELMQNPYSEEIGLRLRDSRRREIRLRLSEGFPTPPLRGLVRVDPEGQVRARYYLDSRLRLRREGAPLPRGMSAQVSYEYNHCGDTVPLRATSTWQPI
jgi:hypothetical protein